MLFPEWIGGFFSIEPARCYAEMAMVVHHLQSPKVQWIVMRLKELKTRSWVHISNRVPDSSTQTLNIWTHGGQSSHTMAWTLDKIDRWMKVNTGLFKAAVNHGACFLCKFPPPKKGQLVPKNFVETLRRDPSQSTARELWKTSMMRRLMALREDHPGKP